MSPFLLRQNHEHNHLTTTKRWSSLVIFLQSRRMRFMGLFMIVVLGGTYLWLVNSSATAGFYLSDLEKHVTILDEEYSKRELEVNELQSMEYLAERSKKMNLVVSEKVEYVSGAGAVAMGKN